MFITFHSAQEQPGMGATHESESNAPLTEALHVFAPGQATAHGWKRPTMTGRPWWRDAVIYEVYPRSFADSNGDGEGDLRGILDRLEYLDDLGVDALWITPWFPSPMADGGYDVTDYCDIDRRFGSLADAQALIEAAHERGIRIVIDMVANHTSRHHPWFEAALRAEPGSAPRQRYIFRDGGGPQGALPPNNWISAFGGSAWTRTTEPDGTPGQWYLHTFAPDQPDLNWQDPAVLESFDAILRFWFDRGVDGIRVDAAPAFAKDPSFRDADYGDDPRFIAARWEDNPHWDVEGVHDVLRRWRRIGDSYPQERMFVAEAVVNSSERLSRYLRPDEVHTAFNFQFLKAGWGPGLRDVIDETLAALAPTGSPATWVLAGHDEPRLVTRYGRERTSSIHIADDEGAPWDRALGTRRARAAALLLLALPGGAYLYQGEELGLPEVEDIPESALQDPMWERSGRTIRGRDGSRVPMPWEGSEPPYGFSTPGSRTWLPQPADWAELTVAAESTDPDSMLTLYREALRLRRELADLHSEDLSWNASPRGVLDFTRGTRVRCIVNLSADRYPLPECVSVLLSSAASTGASIPPDGAVWLMAEERRSSP